MNHCNVASNSCLRQLVVSPNLHPEPLLGDCTLGSAIQDLQRLEMANGSDLGHAALKRTCPSIAGQQQGILGRGNPMYPTSALHTITQFSLWILLFTFKWAGGELSAAESCQSLGSSPLSFLQEQLARYETEDKLHLSSSIGTYPLLLWSKKRGSGAVPVGASGRQDGSQGKVRLDAGPKGTT